MPDDADYMTEAEVNELLTAPGIVEELPGGGWRAAKGGHVGTGPTRDAALRALGEKLWAAASRPKL